MEDCDNSEISVKREQNFDFVDLDDPTLFADDPNDARVKLETDVVRKTPDIVPETYAPPVERSRQKESLMKHEGEVSSIRNNKNINMESFKFNGVSVPIEIKSETIYNKYRDAKLYCRKCGEAFDYKSDLFNHMFIHIGVILAEAEYIKQNRLQENKVQVKKDELVEDSKEDIVVSDDDRYCDNYTDDYDYFGDNQPNLQSVDDTKHHIKYELDIEYEPAEKTKLIDVQKHEIDDDIKPTTSVDVKEAKKTKVMKKDKKTKDAKMMLKLKKKKKKIKIEKTKEGSKSKGHERRRRKKGEEPQVYECNDCSYKSMELWAMRKHCVIHLPNNPFKCTLCDFSCKTRFSLNSHFSRHTGEKKYKCDYCERCFRTRSIWARHIEIHNDKNHTCHICAKKFYRSDSLRYHLMTHSDQRPYKCHLCPYGAKHPKTLKIHIDNHDEQKKYNCPSCDFKSSRRSTMNKHYQVHNTVAQYKCEHCSFSCRAWTTLKKHGEVHRSNAHVFSCTECEFISTTERAVMRHLRQHQHIPLKMLQMKVKAINRDLLPRI